MSYLFNWTKTIHLVRGLPGEGKSTLALSLVGGNKEQVVENDDFWITPNNKYHYIQSMTHIAGTWAWAETFRRLRVYDEIAVANTFVKRQHIFGYVNEALVLGVNVKIHRPKTEWAGDANQCFLKNIHSVPMEVIERMKAQWEECTQEELDILMKNLAASDI